MRRAGAAARDDAFADFVRAHSAGLLRTGYLLTRNAVDAEELVQDTLVALYPRWEQVERAAHQVAYVRKSLVNRFLAGKRLKSAGELYLADASPAATAAAVTPDQTAGVDDRDLLWRAMADLTERQRAALVLRFFHDLPDDQVADMLDCEMGTVRSLISRGLAILRATGTFADDEVGSYYLRNAR